MTYDEFLKTKEIRAEACGFDIDHESITPYAFDYQKDIIAWACKKGKCAILTGCGSGKTLMQLEWCRAVHEHTGKPVLIIAPLSVVRQTQGEARKFKICEVSICRKAEDVTNGVNITNYEMIEHFDPSAFSGVCLDESSILKSYTGKYQTMLTDMYRPKRTRADTYFREATNERIALNLTALVAVLPFEGLNSYEKWLEWLMEEIAQSDGG